jgi:hypothetical protein
MIHIEINARQQFLESRQIKAVARCASPSSRLGVFFLIMSINSGLFQKNASKKPRLPILSQKHPHNQKLLLI